MYFHPRPVRVTKIPLHFFLTNWQFLFYFFSWCKIKNILLKNKLFLDSGTKTLVNSKFIYSYNDTDVWHRFGHTRSLRIYDYRKYTHASSTYMRTMVVYVYYVYHCTIRVAQYSTTNCNIINFEFIVVHRDYSNLITFVYYMYACVVYTALGNFSFNLSGFPG